MKRLLLAVVAALFAALLIAGPVAAADVPTGTLELVSVTSTTVTLHAEQTAGPAVELRVTQFCYGTNADGDPVYLGSTTQAFTGSADLVFAVGPVRVKGTTYGADDCWAQLVYRIDGNSALYLAGTQTVP